MRCARCQADFCVMSRSRCNFMLESPFRFVVSMYAAMTHFWAPRFEFCMTVPVRSEKNLRHFRQR